MPTRLSVVVPFHNLEPYLGACLESLTRQTFRDFEAIMVDDGSTDDSAVVAKEFAARDDRFRLVQHVEAQGPGPARNTGIAEAAGEYLAFADGDDVLAPYAYELMVGSLDTTGSDIVSGNVRRFDSAKSWPCWLHSEACAKTRLKTHIREHRALLQDRTVWNKVFRRSFWDEHRLSYPHMLYEDPPVMISAHVLAGKVDVLEQVVYYWRRREGSITRRRDEPANLGDRMKSVEMVQRFLKEHAPELKADFDRYALDVDLGILTESLVGADEETRRQTMELGVAALEHSEAVALRTMPVNRRLRFHLMGRRMLPELLEALAFEKTQHRYVEYVRRGRLRKRWYAEYPFFEDAAKGVPLEVYEVNDELKLWSNVDEMRWQDGRLRIEGHANFERLAVAAPADLGLRAWLERKGRGGRRVPLDVVRSHRPDVTGDSHQGAVSYDWSGFVAEIDPALLKTNGKWRPGSWRLRVEASVPGHKAVDTVRSPGQARVKWTSDQAVDGPVRMRPVAGGDGLLIQIRVDEVTLTGHRRVGGELELNGRLNDSHQAGSVQVRASRMHSLENVQRPASVEADGTFTARLPLDELVSAPAVDDAVTGIAQVRDAVDWDVVLMVGDRTVKIGMPGEALEGRYAVSGREFALTRTRYGNLRGVERSHRLVADRVVWIDDRLVVTGDFAGTESDRPDRLVLRRRRSSDRYEFPLSWEGGRFTTSFAPARVPAFGEELPLGSGVWELYALTDGRETNVVSERGALGLLPEPRVAGAHRVTVDSYQVDALLLRIRLDQPDEDRGAFNRRRIRRADYPEMRRRPLRDRVVFDAYSGMQYSCSPRAIYEELQRTRPDLDFVWVSKDGRFNVPGSAQVVYGNTREHYRAMADARYVVGNFGVPEWFDKRPGQTYLQTWHGTPLKRLAHDLSEMSFRRTESLDWMDREIPAWDALVSPNPFTSQVLRRAFRYEGEILETGYPRNDILNGPERGAIARRVRERLGVPRGKKVVLYAPTWRDDHHFAAGKRGFSLELDLARARRALGEDYVVLVRAHYLITDRTWSQRDGSVIDVSGYSDIAELYLVADMLITDYSSAMFDFAVTGKPQLFFTYDLETYRDTVRGFYFDFEAQAPGPLLRSSEEVFDAIRDVDHLAAKHAERYTAFVERYCPYDDGSASKRVIQAFFDSTA
ncbi:CDP-glycerol glycerophosphotransferase family protein [Spirillospora sp. CA-253888]